MKTKETLQHIKANGYGIDFSTVFNRAFENYKKIALNAGLVMILLTMVVCFLAGIFIVGVIGMAISADSMEQFKVENMSPLWLLVYLFFIMILTVIGSPINAGLLKMARSAEHGETFSVGTIFDYYRGPYFKEIVMATVVIAFFSTTLSLGLQWVGFPLLGMLLSFAISTFTFLVIPLIVFGELTAMDAIEGSILVVSKQFWILLALLVVSMIFAMLGFFGFCIGIFFTVPFIYSVYYTIYREILGDDSSEELPATESVL